MLLIIVFQFQFTLSLVQESVLFSSRGIAVLNTGDTQITCSAFQSGIFDADKANHPQIVQIGHLVILFIVISIDNT